PVEDLEVLVLRDASASTDAVQPPGGGTVERAAGAYLKEATGPEQKPKSDRVGVIRFAREAAVESLPGTSYQSGLGAIAAPAGRARHVPVDVMPLEYHAEHEVVVERLDAPARKREGEPFSLRVVMRSTNAAPVRGKLTVNDRGRAVDMDLAAPGVQAARADA